MIMNAALDRMWTVSKGASMLSTGNINSTLAGSQQVSGFTTADRLNALRQNSSGPYTVASFLPMKTTAVRNCCPNLGVFFALCTLDGDPADCCVNSHCLAPPSVSTSRPVRREAAFAAFSSRSA